jgi:hypothetical protein
MTLSYAASTNSWSLAMASTPFVLPPYTTLLPSHTTVNCETKIVEKRSEAIVCESVGTIELFDDGRENPNLLPTID